MRAVILAAVLTATSPMSARASMTLDCQINDSNISFELMTHVGSTDYWLADLARPTRQVSLQLKLPGVPAEIRALELVPDLKHHWMAGNRLDLHFFGEFNAKGEDAYMQEGGVIRVELIYRSERTSTEQLEFNGRYQLDVRYQPDQTPAAKTFKAKGKGSCVLG